MKRTIYLIIIFIVSIFFGLRIYVDFVPYPTFPTSVELKDNGQKICVNEGKKLATTTCLQCHFNFEHNALSGKKHGNPKRLGDFHSSNITQDLKTGIGTWSNEELYLLLRSGIKKDGTVAFDMPKYPLLSEHDILSLIAFLKSDDPLVRPVENHTPNPSYSLMTKVYIHFFLKPEPLLNYKVEHPDTNNSFQFGKYLVNAKYSCFDCHSKNSITNNYSFPEKSLGYLKGGNRHANENREIIYTPGIILNDNNKAGLYSANEFHYLLTRGIKRNGDPVSDPMFPYPSLNEIEIKAIYTYLQNCCNE